MSQESFQERTEKPTPKKRRDALKKGQVPRSQEVTTAFLLLAAAAVVSSGSAAVTGAVVDLFGRSALILTALPVGVEGVTGFLRFMGWKVLLGMAPVLLAMAGTALAVSAIQARGVLSLEPLKPQWNRMDPIRKIPQVWGWRAVMELGKSVLKFGIVSLAVFQVLSAATHEVQALGQTTPYAILDFVRRYTARMLLSAGLAYLALAMADYAFQLWQNEKQLRMSREEIKKELKESEGDQVIKVRRRTIARQLARRRMMRSVPEADVVVTNPTHIAVALKYDPAMAEAPTVLAMGERKVAERIKQIARDAGVPVLENKPLARALLATARVGFPIPVDLFVAVAEVLAFVYRTYGGGPPSTRATAGRGSRPEGAGS